MTKTKNIEQEVLLDFEGSKIALVVMGGKPYFSGIDVAEALEYENPQDALDAKLSYMDIIKREVIHKGQEREMLVIDDLGVMSLESERGTEKSGRFGEWLLREVLPPIYNYRKYLTASELKGIEELQENINKLSQVTQKEVAIIEEIIHDTTKLGEKALSPSERVATIGRLEMNEKLLDQLKKDPSVIALKNMEFKLPF